MNTTVFVGNLAWSTTSESLKTLLETIAPVESVTVQTHTDTGRSKGWALASFVTREGMEQAVKALMGREVEGRPLFMREDRTAIEKEEGFVVFVGNLPWEMNPDGLRQVFAKYSPYDVHIKTNMSGRSRGFGLLRFRTSEEAQRVIEEMHGTVVKERKILVRLDRAHLEMMGKAPPLMEMSETVTCGNIPWHTGDDVLACHFAQAGRLVSCQIQRHADTLRSKGWAIIRYLTPEEGANAVRTLHRTVLDGRSLNVRIYRPSKGAGAGGAAGATGGGNPADGSQAHFGGVNGLPYGAGGAANGGLAPGVISSLHPPPPAMHDMMLGQANGHPPMGMGVGMGVGGHEMYYGHHPVHSHAHSHAHSHSHGHMPPPHFRGMRS